MRQRPALLIGSALFLGSLALYLSTAATGTVPGDPAEYTFVAHLLGIAHPPGYAFMTLLTKAWQMLMPLGSVAQRSHWLAAAAGTLTGVLVFGIVWQISSDGQARRLHSQLLPALFASLSVIAAADHWQHSIHVNPHIITVTLNALVLFLLLRWSRTGRDRWLYASCVVAGLGLTHHPLTVFSLPAYALFVILTRPQLIRVTARGWWRERHWGTLLSLALFGLLGLTVWLYYPIRSPMEPAFGPHDMNTLDGFLNVVLARGLRVNLFHFGLSEQGQRLLVFWTLLRQQFASPVIALTVVGLAWLARRQQRVLALLGIAFLVNLVFVINTVQDVMAYLLTPFMLVSAVAGVGARVLTHLAETQWERGRARWADPVLICTLWLALLVWPALNLFENAPRISLREYRAGDEYVASVLDRFEGSGEGATLLNDWEHITPLWYSRYVDGRWPEPADVTPIMVSSDRPWPDWVFEHLPGGPVYLSGYRREIVEAGFRLRPDGGLYQVIEPGDETLPGSMRLLPPLEGQPIELLRYRLSDASLPAGGIVSLDLAMRAPITPTDYLIPFARLGSIDYQFTTDSHLLTPLWRPGEVIVERFDIALPLDLPAGPYPLSIGMANLSAGTHTEATPVAELAVSENPSAPRAAVLDKVLANFGQRVAVDRVSVRGGGQRRTAIWNEPLVLRPGDDLNVTIKWRCLARIEESYTVFVHLMDAANQVWDQQDYTPLGGSNPTHLWIPKWLPGQTALDPYTLTVPAGVPPGEYYLEIGLYGMTTRQRIYQYDRAGNLVGDRLVLGPVLVH